MSNDNAGIEKDEVSGQEQETVLFVDDEQNILNSLRRLFRAEGYRILTAAGGEEGLAVVEQERIDLVVSDMRMPGMNGAQLLEQVRLKSPDTVRILLTGYADMGSTIAAINKGQIYRYIAKPWEDNDLLLSVRHALERKRLERERDRLGALARRQNEELKTLNAGLEDKVQQRTAELSKAMQSLEAAHDKLKRNFLTSIKIFTSLMELREGGMAGHSRRVADLVRKLAQRLGMGDTETNDVVFAALLHDIGKIGLPDAMLQRPFATLNKEERNEFIKHPLKGQATLMGLDQFDGAAPLVRSHHERFDGLGYPDGLRGTDIPLGARVLAVANDYDGLQQGKLVPKNLSPREARAFIAKEGGGRYDPSVVEAFLEVVGGTKQSKDEDLALTALQLVPGMVLSRDLITPEGLLLLAKDCVLTDLLIDQVRRYEATIERRLTLYVYPILRETIPASAD